MTIRKVLNNNVVISESPSGKELVAMGKGLAFGKKAGDAVDERLIEKRFALESGKVSTKFQQILGDIPMEHILLTERIIAIAKSEYGKELQDIIYVSLSDHVHSAIERYRGGVVLKNPLMFDIKRFYPEEFKIGLVATALMKEASDIDFLPDEAAFIAMHFVNSEINGDIANIYEITKVMDEISELVVRELGLSVDDESISYFRFLSHLKYFAQRVLFEANDADGSDSDLRLAELLRERYPEASRCSALIAQLVEQRHGKSASDDELAYLTLYIERMRKTASKEHR